MMTLFHRICKKEWMMMNGYARNSSDNFVIVVVSFFWCVCVGWEGGRGYETNLPE